MAASTPVMAKITLRERSSVRATAHLREGRREEGKKGMEKSEGKKGKYEKGGMVESLLVRKPGVQQPQRSHV